MRKMRKKYYFYVSAIYLAKISLDLSILALPHFDGRGRVRDDEKIQVDPESHDHAFEEFKDEKIQDFISELQSIKIKNIFFVFELDLVPSSL